LPTCADAGDTVGAKQHRPGTELGDDELDRGWRVGAVDTTVPEPGTLALLVVRLAALAFCRWREVARCRNFLRLSWLEMSPVVRSDH
jgi:hypothetical protein